MTRFIGGATVPHPLGGALSITWPFVAFEISESALTLKYRAPWIRKVAHLFSSGRIPPSRTPDSLVWWAAEIDDISLVRVGPRSILVKSKLGDCSFGSPRFLPSSHGKIEKVRTVLDVLQLKVEVVHSNFFARLGMKGQSE
jgi:hypothetical protein